jgi:hypothetical protein
VLVELCVLFFERFREEEVYSDNQKAQKKNTDRYLIIMNFVVFIPVFIFVVTFHNTMEIDKNTCENNETQEGLENTP